MRESCAQSCQLPGFKNLNGNVHDFNEVCSSLDDITADLLFSNQALSLDERNESDSSEATNALWVFFLVSHVGERPWRPIQSPTRKKEEMEGLRGERDQIKLINLKFKRWQVVRFRKARKSKTFHKLHVRWMNDDLRDIVCGLGS